MTKPKPNARRGRPRSTGGHPIIGLRMPPDVIAAVDEVARLTEASRSSVIVDAVREHCEGLLAAVRAVAPVPAASKTRRQRSRKTAP